MPRSAGAECVADARGRSDAGDSGRDGLWTREVAVAGNVHPDVLVEFLPAEGAALHAKGGLFRETPEKPPPIADSLDERIAKFDGADFPIHSQAFQRVGASAGVAQGGRLW